MMPWKWVTPPDGGHLWVLVLHNTTEDRPPEESRLLHWICMGAEVGCCRSKCCWLPQVCSWAAGQMPFACITELMKRYITMTLLIVITSTTKIYCLGHPKAESSDTLMAYCGLVSANAPNATHVREPEELYGYLFFLSCDVSPCVSVNGHVATVSWKHTKGGVMLEHSTNIL